MQTDKGYNIDYLQWPTTAKELNDAASNLVAGFGMKAFEGLLMRGVNAQFLLCTALGAGCIDCVRCSLS